MRHEMHPPHSRHSSLMDVSASHRDSSETCVVQTSAAETVGSLKERVLQELGAGSAVATTLEHAGVAYTDETLLSSTPISCGDAVVVVPYVADIQAHCYEGDYYSAALSPCERWLYLGGEDAITKWSTETCTQVWSVGSVDRRDYMKISPSGALLAVLCMDEVNVGDTSNGEILHFMSFRDVLTCLCFTADSNFVVVGCVDGSVWMHSVRTSDREELLAVGGSCPMGVAANKDYLVVALCGSLQVLSLATKGVHKTLETTSVSDTCVCLSDTNVAVSSAYKSICVWDVHTGSCLKTFALPCAPNKLAWCESRRLIARRSSDEVQYLSLDSGDLCCSKAAPDGGVIRDVHLSRDGHWVVVLHTTNVSVCPVSLKW